MSKQIAPRGPRRAAEAELSEPRIDDIDVDVETHTPRSARRRRGLALGRGAVASIVAGVLASGVLFGYAFSQRDGAGADDLSSENVAVDIAVPAAAVDAAQQGFADRSEAASRNQVRAGLGEAVADEAAKDRDAALEATVDGAMEAVANETAAERDAKMDADLVLVEKQAAKLKKEAEEAQRRLEEARKAALQAGVDEAKLSTISDEDLAAASSKGGSMPVHSNYRIGAGYGARGSWSRYHTGQDFPAPVGTPIYAAASGIVLSPTSGGWAGTNVVIQHSNGGATLYAHMSRKVVRTGQAVKAGQLIGYVGNTGRSFGPHLHFEYYKPGVTPGSVYNASNPLSFLRSLGVRVG